MIVNVRVILVELDCILEALEGARGVSLLHVSGCELHETLCEARNHLYRSEDLFRSGNITNKEPRV